MNTIKTWQERKKEQPLEPSSLLAQHEINELRTELAIERGCRIAVGGERDELRAKLAACEARERHTCGTLNKLLAAGAAPAWNDFIEVACARIKSADDASADGDYMLDSDDCIKVLRGTWQGNFLHDKPAKQQHAAGAAPPKVLMNQLISDKVELQHKLDVALKKLAELEGQEPVGRVDDDGCSGRVCGVLDYDATMTLEAGTKLYTAAPVPMKRSPAMHDAVRKVLKYYGLTKVGNGVVEADLIEAMLAAAKEPT